ncbi:MAG: serpin family protein [Elusimicrobiales bacterium]|nr:serpin family protein [Elusimicrobiales bacterium]
MKLGNLLAAILVSGLVQGLSAAETKEAAPALTPAARANAIAFKFYSKAAGKPGNVFFSPYSIHTAFAMVYEGARGKTAQEIAGLFAFQPGPLDRRASFESLKKDLAEDAKGAEFTQANSFWAQEGYSFRPAYIKSLRAHYDAEAGQVDFAAKTEAARGEINGWTEKRTKGKIKELFPKGALNPLSRLVLVNAVYFKGTWLEPFSKDMTADADFTKTGGEKVKVKMMAAPAARKAEYSESDELQALRLPYKGGSLSMLVLLPREGKTLADTEKALTPEKLEAIRKGLEKRKVKVFLPRFTFSSGFTLNDTLSELGMPAAFTEGAADFSGMDGTNKLYIQTAFHKAFVEVNEEGTEAAAATGVAMGVKSMSFDMFEFRANRPFLFFIEDAKTGLILFMGRMEEPKTE